MKCYRNGGCGPYEMYSCSECPASKEDYIHRVGKTNTSTEFNLKDLEELVEKVRIASQRLEAYISCPPDYIDEIKEYWGRYGPVKAGIFPTPSITYPSDAKDQIWIIPAAELEKSIKLVLPEIKEEIRKYLEIDSEGHNL